MNITGLVSVTPEFVMVQSIGMIAFAVAVVRLQCRDKNTIIFLNFIASGLFGFQNIVLGALPGALMAFGAAMRSGMVLMPIPKRWRVFLILSFLSVAAIFASLLRENDLALIILLPPFLMAYAELQGGPFMIRCVTLFNDSLWLTYNVSIGSVGGTLCCMSTLTSAVTAIIRYDLPMVPLYQRAMALVPVRV